MNALVAVGIGNTTVKCGWAESAPTDGQVDWRQLWEGKTLGFDPGAVADVLPRQACRWYVASVHRATEVVLRHWLGEVRPQDDYRCLTYRDLPLTVDVEFPERVGMDRLVAALAANRLRSSGSPAIVVDAGTAITVDLVDAHGVFRGGVILAGFGLTARALAAGTDLLPAVDTTFQRDPPPVIGRSTEQAIRSGLFWGGIGAIRELVGRIESQLATSTELFVTGGDAERLTDYLSEHARFVPDLVLQGVALAAKAN